MEKQAVPVYVYYLGGRFFSSCTMKPPKTIEPDSPQNDPADPYSIEQAISDKAQLSTIAFDALAFFTGNLGSDSFFPPGKVADFFRVSVP